MPVPEPCAHHKPMILKEVAVRRDGPVDLTTAHCDDTREASRHKLTRTVMTRRTARGLSGQMNSNDAMPQEDLSTSGHDPLCRLLR